MKKTTFLFFVFLMSAFFWQGYAQTGNTCGDPLIITGLPFLVTDNTSNYGDDYGPADRPPLATGAVGNPNASYLGGDDVVYSYTPAANGSIDISVTNHGTWAGVFVFTGCPFASTVGGHTTSSSSTELKVNSLPVVSGETYYIVISTYAAPQSTSYTLNVSENLPDCPILQANIGDACDDGNPNTVGDVVTADCECLGEAAGSDTCADAIALVCNASPVTYSPVGSTAVAPSGCSIGANGIWFSFLGTGADITINSSADFDHKMSMQTGACGALDWIACKDGSSGAETYTISSTVANQMYYVYVAHFSTITNPTGTITISLDCAVVPNCTAPALTLAVQDAVGAPIVDCLNTGDEYYVLATLSGGDGNTSYNVSANAGNVVEVTANGFVVLGPFAQGVAANVNVVGVQDQDCVVTASASSPALCPPVNNDCQGALPLVCGETITGSTFGATASGLSATCGNYTSSTARDLFYSFEADGSSNYTISLDAAGSGSFDGVLFVYSGACGSLVSLGCSDSGNPEEMELLVPAAGTYIVRFFRYSGTGDFSLTTTCNSLSIENNNLLSAVSLYPNPMNGNAFYINAPKLNGETLSVTVNDMLGREIQNGQYVISDGKVKVDLNQDTNDGIYLVTLSLKGENHVFRVVKR